jgi:hypothetical protein
MGRIISQSNATVECKNNDDNKQHPNQVTGSVFSATNNPRPKADLVAFDLNTFEQWFYIISQLPPGRGNIHRKRISSPLPSIDNLSASN